VHFVTDELDGGPVILQAKVPVFAGDSEEEITARVQAQEHAIYPLVISWFVDGRLRMAGNHAWLDERQLPRRAMPPTNEQPAPRHIAGLFLIKMFTNQTSHRNNSSYCHIVVTQ
jgi:phosphoribosylglycinamide formyltransferase-1